MIPSPVQDGILAGSIHACMQSQLLEFIGAAVLSCWANDVLLQTFTTCDSYNLSAPLLMMIPKLYVGAFMFPKIDVPF